MKAPPTPVLRTSILLVAFAVVAASCTSSSSEPTTTVTAVTTTSTVPQTTSTTVTTVPTTTTTTTIAVRPQAEVPTFEDDAVEIEVDFAVKTGTLDNGLVYYVRANDRPGQRAQLRLAVRAGSVQEQANQSGGAHYLEHMLFNGTEKYPANDLIQVLQEFGSRFGPDINAYTNWEETVYELNLPTDRAELLPTGFDVLFEWATAATIDPDEVDLERGVLLEEWRLRSQSFSGRYFEGVIESLLAGTPYEGQHTLAGPDVLESTTPEALRSFYEDWYRTDNMAIVAVGDFDVFEVEDLIQETFGGIEASEGPPLPDLFANAATEPGFFVLADPEYQQSFVELNYPLPSLEAGTVGTVRQEMAFDLAWGVLVTRLEEDALGGDTVYFGPSFAANPLVRTQQSPGLAAFADPDELALTAEALLGEVERALIHGFTQEELDRASQAMRANINAEFERSDTTQDGDYADRYVEHFLGNAPVPSARRAVTLQRRLLDEMTLDQVVATFRANIQSTEPFVIVVGPEDAAAELPTEDDLSAILDQVRVSNFEERTDPVDSIEELMEPPEATEIIDVTPLPASILDILTLENGARVILLPTEVVDNVVVVGATSFGGWSLVDADDVVEAQLISDVVLRSGVAEFDQLTLERHLSGRNVFISPYIDETSEGFFGRTVVDELETLFQLLHLYATAPRVDEIGLRLAIDEIRPFAEDPTSNPQLAVDLEIANIRFGGDPRFLPIPTVEDLDTFDLDKALEVFRERFADASNFVFVVAGDIDAPEAQNLARRYLGSLPSTHSDETYVDVRTERPAGVVAEVVEAGFGELGELSLLWDAPFDLDPVTRVEADLLELVIRQRLTDRIREQLSATYSPSTRLTVIDDPAPLVELSITISADPVDLDAIATEVIADLADLRDNGPTAEQLAIAQEQLTRNLELFSNELFVQLLTFYMLRPHEDPGDIFLAIERAQAATSGELRDLAQTLISFDDYIQIQLVPEDFSG